MSTFGITLAVTVLVCFALGYLLCHLRAKRTAEVLVLAGAKVLPRRLAVIAQELGCGMSCNGGSEMRKCMCRRPTECLFNENRPCTERVPS